MTRSLAFAIALLTWTAAATAHADEPASDKARFYIMDGQVIDGTVRRPTSLYFESRKRAQFDRLLRLKKSLRDAVIATAKDRILR